MKDIILKAFWAGMMLFLIPLVCLADNLPYNLGSHSVSFCGGTLLPSGMTAEVTLEVPMNLYLHSYTPQGEIDTAFQPTIMQITRSGQTAPYATSSPFSRTGVSQPEKGFLSLESVPAGTYIITVTGLLNAPCHLFVHGYPINASGTSGPDSSLAIDAGLHRNTFHYSHQRDLSLMPYRYNGDPKARDLFYKFTIETPMYVVINHWGSPLTGSIPDVYGAYTRIYLYKQDAAMTLVADRKGSVGILDSLAISKDWIPEADIADHRLAAWQGFLDAGSYWVLVEDGYLEGASVTTYYEGVTRTNILGICPAGIYRTNAIEVQLQPDETYQFTDQRNMTFYPESVVWYRLTTEEESDFRIACEGADFQLESVATGRVVAAGSSTLVLPELAAGEYLLSMHHATASQCAVTFSRYRPVRDGQTVDRPIIATDSLSNGFSYIDKAKMRQFSNGPAANADINYRFTLAQPGPVVFDHRGTTKDTLLTVLQRADSTEVFHLIRTRDSFLDVVHLPAGTYNYAVRSPDKALLLHTGIRAMGAGAAIDSSHPVGFSQNWNYVASYYPLAAGTATAGPQNSRTAVIYYDKLGRELETVSSSASPFGEDLLQLTEYHRGRPTESWNGVTAPGTAGFLNRDQVAQRAELLYRDTAALARTGYEDNLLDRIASQTGAGAAWHAGGKTAQTEYLVNQESGVLSCAKFLIGSNTSIIRRPLPNGTNWSAGSLSVTKTTDEDGGVSLSFCNALGQVVLERRVIADSTYADTYYCYDDNLLLAAVIPPEAAARVANSSAPIPLETFQQYCYAYTYDDRRRCTQKQIPGAGITRFVYTNSGEVFLSQDEIQRENGEWTCTVPDKVGRPALVMTVLDDGQQMISYRNTMIHAIFDTTQTNSHCYRIEGGTLPIIKETRQILWYDTYAFLNVLAPGLNAMITQAVSANNLSLRSWGQNAAALNGLQTGGILYKSNGNNTYSSPALYVIGYDHYGRSALHWEENVLGGSSLSFSVYDFSGNVIASREMHTDAQNNTLTLDKQNGYDFMGRPLWTSTTVGNTIVRQDFGYTPTGEMEYVRTRTNGQDFFQLDEYNVRGWLTRSRDGAFDERLAYEAPLHSAGAPRWGGDISEIEWKAGDKHKLTSYAYDGLDRLSGSQEFASISSLSADKRFAFTYDKNGNMTQKEIVYPVHLIDPDPWILEPLATLPGLVQPDLTPVAPGIVNQLVLNNYSYSGNQLSFVQDNPLIPNGTDPDYLYDASGRMISDARNNLSLDYNDMNLVRKVKRNGATLANYSYLADGTKVSVLDSLGNGLLYLGSMVFNKTSNGTQLESIAWEGGRIVAEPDGWGGTNMVPLLYSMDHLGSVRAVRNALTGEVVSRSDYEPYGVHTTLSGTPQRYRYNGKEDQSFAGTPYLDYGARQYDPTIGRWMVPDPLAEKSYYLNPYAYCAADPINHIDSNGESWRVTIDENNGRPTGFEWVSEDDSYNDDGTLKEGLFNQAIFFSENGTFDSSSRWNLGSSTAYVYLEDGTIVQYRSCTYPSDLKNYPTIPEGIYWASVGMHYGESASYIALRMSDIGTFDFYASSIELGMNNPAHPNDTTASGVNIHKAGEKDLTGMTLKGKPVSAACFLISKNDWDSFIGHFNNNKQRNNIVGISVSRSMSIPTNKTVPVIRYGTPCYVVY